MRSGEGAAWVSTNDVVTSGFARLAGARLTEVPVDLRGRLPGVLPRDAGNYSGVLLLGPEDLAQPGLLRRALSAPEELDAFGTARRRLRRAAEAAAPRELPSALWPSGCFKCCCAERARCATARVENWAGLDNGLALPGCEQLLHLPVVSTREAFAETCVVFRARGDRLGAITLTRNVDWSAAKRDGEGGPFGGPLRYVELDPTAHDPRASTHNRRY